MTRVALLSGGLGWHVQDLLRAAPLAGIEAVPLDFRALAGGSHDTGALAGFDRVLVRTMPAGSLEQIVFRMDVMHAAAARGVPVLNPPRAVEKCVDKFLTSARLAAAGLPTPPAAVAQRFDDGMRMFDEFGRDVVVKPLFGAEGRGMVRVTDVEVAWRTFKAITQTGGVLYLQPFVRHPGWDLRAFILGGRVLGAMRRFAADGHWRTNVAQGGRAEPVTLSADEERLALRAMDAVGAVVGGVDLLPDADGKLWVLEVNAVPGWRALSQACGLDVAAETLRFLAREYEF